MKRNVGNGERVMRALAAVAMALGAGFAPIAWELRAGLGVLAAYMLFTALAGSCLGYRMIGRSTCAIQ